MHAARGDFGEQEYSKSRRPQMEAAGAARVRALARAVRNERPGVGPYFQTLSNRISTPMTMNMTAAARLIQTSGR